MIQDMYATTRHLKEKAIEEFRLYLIVFAYLALMLGAFTTYRRLVLAQAGISYAHYGAGIIEAAVVAKVILIGQALGVGKRLEVSPCWSPYSSNPFCTHCWSLPSELSSISSKAYGMVAVGRQRCEMSWRSDRMNCWLVPWS